MSKTIIVSREAEADLLDAYSWYENSLEELGSNFIGEAETSFERIATHPELYEEVEKGIRRAVIHTFPYLIFYTQDAESVIVLAVIRASQDPAYIRSRLGA